ncbi:MAG TPA: aminotransferase class V-fold PLP-dependent enzyme [Clostridiales bacterium]|nr:aminotransferase class V-fold PLP-dependent enzyme [Clostridiales bacterium]
MGKINSNACNFRGSSRRSCDKPIIVNFDNAATSFPKPVGVKNAVIDVFTKYGGNVGRGRHSLAMLTSTMVYESRQIIADFFGAELENIVFTGNCTHALNLAIKGVVGGSGHVIISSLEHNSVSRPVAAISRTGRVKYSVARVYDDNARTLQSFKDLITNETKAIVCTLASNVTGQILPYKEIGEICKAKNICFIADGAQVCGVIPVSLSDGINILCTAGHKGLYGTTGTGLLISDGKFDISPIMQGGTGSASLSLEQPSFLPDSLESGTINIVGAASIKAGIDFINNKTIEKIFKHETMLCDMFISKLSDDKRIRIYRSPNVSYVPIVSFNIDGMMPEEVAAYLDKNGFCLRSGFHCAGLAHQNLGTENGTVRLAPSVFNTESEIMKITSVIKKINKNI